MSNFSLRNKLLLLSLFPLIFTLFVLMTVSYYVEKDALTDEVTTFRTKLIGERKTQIKEATEIAAGSLLEITYYSVGYWRLVTPTDRIAA